MPPLSRGTAVGRTEAHAADDHFCVGLHLRTVVNPEGRILHVETALRGLDIERIGPQVTGDVVAIGMITTVNHVRPPVICRNGLVLPFVDIQLSILHIATLVAAMCRRPAHTQWCIFGIAALTYWHDALCWNHSRSHPCQTG